MCQQCDAVNHIIQIVFQLCSKCETVGVLQLVFQHDLLSGQFCDALLDVLGHRVHLSVVHMCACLVYTLIICDSAPKVNGCLTQFWQVFDFEEFFDLVARNHLIVVGETLISVGLTLGCKRFIGYDNPIFSTDCTHITRSITFSHVGVQPFVLIQPALCGASTVAQHQH